MIRRVRRSNAAQANSVQWPRHRTAHLGCYRVERGSRRENALRHKILASLETELAPWVTSKRSFDELTTLKTIAPTAAFRERGS
ncbi:MAG: hypothetical protein ACI8W7_004971 [Gammaproteobacteria bacterium]|jgi:hypothetical protein